MPQKLKLFFAISVILFLAAVFSWSCSQISAEKAQRFPAQIKTSEENLGNPFISSITPPENIGVSKSWGAYAENEKSLFSAQNNVQNPADLYAVFINWDDPFPGDAYQDVQSGGKTLVVFWEQYGTSLDSIITGDSDPYIVKFALDAKSYGGKIILVPFPEMNGNWDPWDGTVGNNTPDKVIAAWKHIHGFFPSAENVKWGWAVNNDSVPDTQANAIASYYPGDAYVDYVGVDGFNFGDPWQTYSDIFSSALKQLRIYNKPIYIFSLACAQGPQKAAWIADAISKMDSDPSIAGWIWFNENKERDWMINSDSDSLQAFVKGI